MKIKLTGKVPYSHNPPTPPQGERPPKLKVSNFMRDGIIYEAFELRWHMRWGWTVCANVYFTDNRLSNHGIDQTALSTFQMERWYELAGCNDDQDNTA